MPRKLPGAFKRPKNAAQRGPRPQRVAPGELPSREAILEAMEANPELQGKRDLARAFGIVGDMRVPFKILLQDMEAEGLITRRQKILRRPAELPSVTVLDIPADADPDHLIAYPGTWNPEEGEKPAVLVPLAKGARVAPGPGDRILARIGREDGVYVAKPMKILDKPRRAQIGIVRLDDDGARLVPVDRKQKEMRIPAGDINGARDGDLVEVEVTVAGRMMLPRARVIKVVGNPHSEGAVSLIALHGLEIPHVFPAQVLREAEAAKEATLKGREDWRALPFVTIDPPDAKDHDDAVLAEADTDPANAGGHIVYVAIADVSAYVTPGGALDREAFLRGNSVYFPDRVVPMLPERISNELCSLKPGVNRAALALRMVMRADGAKKSHSFHRVLIRSAAKLSYQQAQAAIDGRADETTGPLLDTVLKPLWAAFDAMAAARDKRGPLELDLPERRIELDDKGMVARVYQPERLSAHRLIEEMMIAANVAAAETLEHKHASLIYRVHDTPGREKLEALRQFLQTLELAFARTEAVRPSHFNAVLAKARLKGQIEHVSEMILRSQALAEYAPENYGHFGLNLDRYAHFTSPIRRYADLIVHRALIKALGLGADGISTEEEAKLGAIAQHISMTERRAMAAERETQDRLLAHFLSEKVGTSFGGKISGVTRAGLFVKLDETGADGFIPASTIGLDYFRHSEKDQALIGDRTGETFRLGDRVEVRLLEVAPIAGALRFELLSEGSGGRPGGRGKSRTGRTPPARAKGPKGNKSKGKRR